MRPADSGAIPILYPADTIKIARAGIIRVVGEVEKSGASLLKTNDNIPVVQAIALGEVLTHTAAASRERLIPANNQTEKRKEIAVHLGRLRSGLAAGLLLRPKDILCVPDRGAKSALYRYG